MFLVWSTVVPGGRRCAARLVSACKARVNHHNSGIQYADARGNIRGEPHSHITKNYFLGPPNWSKKSIRALRPGSRSTLPWALPAKKLEGELKRRCENTFLLV